MSKDICIDTCCIAVIALWTMLWHSMKRWRAPNKNPTHIMLQLYNWRQHAATTINVVAVLYSWGMRFPGPALRHGCGPTPRSRGLVLVYIRWLVLVQVCTRRLVLVQVHWAGGSLLHAVDDFFEDGLYLAFLDVGQDLWQLLTEPVHILLIETHGRLGFQNVVVGTVWANEDSCLLLHPEEIHSIMLNQTLINNPKYYV